MSGQLVLYDHVRDIVREERRDHKKYIVKVASQEDSRGAWIATAGWDAKVLLYRLEKDEGGDYRLLGSPVAFLNLQSIPETALFINHPSADGSILLVTRRDSTFLFYFSLPPLNQQIGSPPSEPVEMRLLGKQNLAPHSNAWITFSPSSVAVCPTDSTLVAIGTSAVPHMKLLIVRLLVPPLRAQEETSSMPTTQAAQARADLAIQDKEDAAIEIHMSTLAPQTPYSTPQVCWRPNGTGVWTNGDDGTLRGIEARTGKIVSTLKGGHKVGSKIRSIWAGNVDIGGKQEEWVVSGGFDQRLVVWKGFEEGSISHERA
ncbi:hypothetical protein MMC20_004502 [Loxospora ochrophaea]|nr:hypothetical protein [Loxospora ochrophaea]